MIISQGSKPETKTMIQIKLLTENAIMPTRGTEQAAGLDLYAAESKMLISGSRRIVSTGVSIAIPPGFVGLIWPRSGLAVRHGIDVLAGVIDADYRGELCVVLMNHGGVDCHIKAGDRIAQLVIQPFAMLGLDKVDGLPPTVRGAGGFGSTGA
jgi:deoxyuridine 5'-triphosphate nucleotidohydrolase